MGRWVSDSLMAYCRSGSVFSAVFALRSRLKCGLRSTAFVRQWSSWRKDDQAFTGVTERSKVNTPTLRYMYFNLRARGEIPRLILHAAGVPFEDERHERQDWPGTLKQKMPFGQLPVLEIDGVMYPESMSISRYLATEYGLAGKTPLDRLRADYITEQTRTCKEGIYKYFFKFEDDAAKKAEFKKLFDDTRPTFLGYWDQAVKQNSSGGAFIVGSTLSIADLAVMDVLDFVLEDEAIKTYFATNYPDLAKNYSTVTSVPNIKKYRESRPKTVL